MLRRSAVLTRRHVSAFLHEPGSHGGFDAALKRCHAQDIDMASTLSSDFLTLQWRLLPYRVARLGRELTFVLHNPLRSLPTLPMCVLHALLLPTLYWSIVCFGRGSTLPLLTPPPPPPPSSADVTAAATATQK